MLELVKDAEAFAAEIGTELTTIWDEFKAFVRNKPVEEAAPVVEAVPATEPVAAPATPVA